MTERCVRCGEEGEDRRILWMACFYDMEEFDIPFEVWRIQNDQNVNQKFYTLRVCKDCRASWLQAIQDWFDDAPSTPNSGDTYPIATSTPVLESMQTSISQIIEEMIGLKGRLQLLESHIPSDP